MEVKHRTARSLVKRLSSAADAADVHLLEEAICEIRLLSKHDPDSRPLLADAGAMPFLVSHLLSHYDGTSNCCTTTNSLENAVAALLNLSISSREQLMSTPRLIDALSRTLRFPPTPAAVQHAATTLYSLLSVDAYRPIIGSKDEIVSALVSILSAPTSPTRSIKDVLKALFGLSLYPLNRSTLVRLRAVPALFSLVVRDGRTGIVEDATAVIAQVAGCEDSIAAFRAVSGVRVLVDLMDPVGAGWASGRSRENAVSALLNLAMCGGERAVGDIREVEEATLEGIAGLLDSANPRAKTRAKSLMGILRVGRGRQQQQHEEEEEEEQYSIPSSASSATSTSLTRSVLLTTGDYYDTF